MKPIKKILRQAIAKNLHLLADEIANGKVTRFSIFAYTSRGLFVSGHKMPVHFDATFTPNGMKERVVAPQQFKGWKVKP